ncbi:phage holin family protein [Flavobacterium amniphilum]|uniref:phage holin family protein n=1 Tax=Flavobacterium amniphilum TaxID=1834035 RepID=UPI00202A2BA8|nr:phage holin family protein [Flavobacterium amniphilum]MCL9806252.1 phage holin family protein [Flavobacterium amniphilum]
MNTMATNKKLLISKTENFTKTSIDLLKLNMVEKTADIVSSVTSKLVILLIVAMFIFFLNIGLSLWISEILQSSYLGFLIVSGFYLIISVAVYLYQWQWLKNPISDRIVTKLLKNVNLDEELNPEHYE